VKQIFITGAFPEKHQRKAPYYYPCTYCCSEECRTDNKEDCQAFVNWFCEYYKEEDCINCPLQQQ
jgi:hypothetical protein